MDTSTEQIVEYVRGYGVPINVLFFEYLQDGEREYLARSWLSDPGLEAPSGSAGKKQAPWNGLDFFVAVGENQTATGTTCATTGSSPPATGRSTARP